MVATMVLSESNTVSQTVTDTISNINFGSTDATGLTPASYPITAGTNSYSKYIRMKFSGTFNKVDNFRVYASTAAPATNASIVFDTVTAASYATPSATSIGTTAVPTTQPASYNIGASAGLSSAGYSDYCRLQLKTAANTPAGNVTQVTFTFAYDEQ